MMERSVKVHDVFIVVLLLWRFLDSTFQAVAEVTNNSTICNTTNTTWMMLSCSSNSWYHVIQELYSPVNNNCSLINNNNTLQENSNRELVVSCVGPANSSVCEESVKKSTRNYNEAFVQVTYECIDESKIYKLDVKQKVMLEDEGYLASPLMFATSEQKLFNGCLCEITNVSKAEVLYADVENSNLNITCGTWTRNEFLFLATVVNIDLVFVTKPCTMRIIYQDDNRSDSPLKGRVWIKVSGSNMTLNCSEQLPDSVSTPSTTTMRTMSSTKTSLTTSLTSQESYPYSTTSQQVSSTTQSTSTTSQQVSTTLKSTSSTSHPVYSTTQSTATISQPVYSTLQTTSSTSHPVYSTTQSTSTTSQPVYSTTQSTSRPFRDISAISQSTRITPIYLIVPIVVGGVALVATVVAILAVRTRCCQTRAKTRDRDNCGGLGEDVPALEDKDNRLSTHSCDVYVDLDDVSITPLPDSTALCPATIQNGVSGPEGSDVIMFDNVAYVSGNDIISKRDVTKGDDSDSDEVLMVDNVVYELSAPVGTIKIFQNERTGGVDDKDEVTMVDNVVYSSSQSTSPV